MQRCAEAFACAGGLATVGAAARAATPEEREVAQRVAAELSGPGGACVEPAVEPAVEGLDGVSHIVLQDYVEHVAGFAVGSASVCGFLGSCFG